MSKKALNVRKVYRKLKDGTKVLRGYSARLQFRVVWDESQKKYVKPSNKEFFGRTEWAAVAVRSGYEAILASGIEKANLDTRVTLSDYISNTFLPARSRHVDDGDLSVCSYGNIASQCKRYVLGSRMAQIQLNKLKPTDVEAFFVALKKDGEATPITQAKIKTTLGTVFQMAKSHLLPGPNLTWRDFLAFEIHKMPVVTAAKKKTLFDLDKVWETIFDESKPLVYRTMVAMQLTIQCRPQDLWALTWDNVDTEKHTVTFYRAVRKTRRGWEATLGSKTTHKTARRVEGRMEPLDPDVSAMLRRRRGDAEGTALVFPGTNGVPINGSSFHQTIWPRLKSALGLTGSATFYALKTMGSTFTIIDGGADPFVQAARMGHSTPKEALSHYLSVSIEQKRDALKVWQQLPRPTAALPTEEGNV